MITNDDGVVNNKKIRPLFKNLYKALGFDDDFHYEPSLESQVSTWIKQENESNSDDLRFTSNLYPEIIRSIVWNLRYKHENLPTQSAVQRFLTKAGVTIIEKIPALRTLNEKRRQAYETGSERDRIALMDRHYSIKYHLSMTHSRTTICTFRWVGSRLVEIASDLFLPQEVIVIEALVAGVAVSQRWVPNRHRDSMIDEMMRFISWVEGLSEKG